MPAGCWQPAVGPTQVSAVQGLPSSQESLVPPQVPPVQWSATVQTLLSLQLVPFVLGTTVQLAVPLHVLAAQLSVVQVTLAPVQTPPEQRSP